MTTCQVPESVWINPWVKPALNELKSITNSCSHTHSFAEAPNELSTTPNGWFKQEGINPMSYGLNVAASPSAIASVTIPSDEQKKIDYLNNRAQSVYYTIEGKLQGMFHLRGPSSPRYYKELIDAIKNDEYEIDEKEAQIADENWEHHLDNEDDYFDYSAFYGINFTKFPKADYKGRDKAYIELRAELQAVKDVIAIMPAEEALARIQAFEKWVPSNAPAVQ